MKNNNREYGLALFLKILGRIALFLFSLGWIACPFLLDWISGTEFVKYIPTHFNKGTWFSFWGSYLPGTAFGLIALFNTIQIQNQQKQLEKLQTAKRFRPTKNAIIYRFDLANKKIGEYSVHNIRTKLEKTSGAYKSFNIENGYLLKFSLMDYVEHSVIQKVEVESIEWEIAKKKYEQSAVDLMDAWKVGLHNDICVFWIYNKNTDIDNILMTFDNYNRENADYWISMLKMSLKIILADRNTYQVCVEVELESDKDTTTLKAASYDCVVK